MAEYGNIMLKNKGSCTVKPKASDEIKVTVHIPKNVHENVRKQKINRIYDILHPEISQ